MKKVLRMDKKGSALTDIFIFMVLALSVAIGIGVTAYVWFTADPIIEDAFDNVNTDGEGWNGSRVYDESIGPTISSINIMKWGTVAVLISMVLSIILGSFLVNVSPIFFIAYVIIAIIATIISFPISNLYEEIYLNATLNATLKGFWGMSFILLNLPYWVITTMAIAGMVMFINYMRKDTGSYGSGGVW